MSHKEILDELKLMGFSEEYSKIALEKTNATTIEEVIEWMGSNPEKREGVSTDEKSSQEVSSATKIPGLVPQKPAYRCSDCRKLIYNEADATRHATQTKHANFEEFIPEPGEELPPEPTGPKLSEEEKNKQLEILQNKIKERKALKEIEEENAKLEKEKERRKDQKELQAAKEKWQKDKEKKEEEMRRKEKLEEQKAKDEIKRKIAEDKAKRENKAPPTQQTQIPQPIIQAPATAAVSSQAKKEYDACTIQIRLQNGNRIEGSFKPTDTLSTLFDFVKSKGGPNSFSLMLSYPKKNFTKDMGNTTLKEADLVPRAMLIVNSL